MACGRLALFLFLPLLVFATQKYHKNLDVARCRECRIPATLKGCGALQNPYCAQPFSEPYKGQNHVSTCARLKCPPYHDLYINSAVETRDGDYIAGSELSRPILNPQTIICTRYDEHFYRFMYRDGSGFMRLVQDAHCRQNNFPRHSCIVEGFVKQTCTRDAKCRKIKHLSDYGGNKCDSKYKLMMRYVDSDRWERMSKLSCDRDLGWWRIHFPNGTWMHTRHGTVATCVMRIDPQKISNQQETSFFLLYRMGMIIILTLSTIFLTFNSYMCRSIVVWEGSNWHRTIWQQDLGGGVVSMEREDIQNQLNTQNQREDYGWNKLYKDGVYMDLRQYDIMLRSDVDTGYCAEMTPWTLLDDFDYIRQKDEAKESHA